MRRHGWLSGALVITLFVSGCATAERAADPAGAAPLRHEALNTTLWTQTAVEFRATALQAYELARLRLDEALTNSGWTASVEQLEAGGYEDLPPAVVLDVDETVLDNAAYQARLILEDRAYETAHWNAWVEERRAAPIPGAVAFTRYAAERGVTVIYLTNRRHTVEQATYDNLAAYGFPLDPEGETLITRGERPEWAGEDKGPRRRAVAERYRILLMVGDNLGDFLSHVDQSVEARDALSEPYAAYWGTRWIMLPNPQYGSWEGALFDFDYSLTPEDRLRRKYERLDPEGTPLPKH